MPPTDTGVDVVVSLQVRGAEDRPWEGHLAAGLLFDIDVVVAPTPPSSLLDRSIEFEVLIIPMQLRSSDLVERIRPARIDVLRLQGTPDPPIAAIIRLTQPSRHPLMLGSYDECDLRRAFRDHGDMWAALESLEAIPGGLRDGPSQDVLRRVPQIEREQRLALRRDYEIPSFNNWPWCIFTPRCEPCNPLGPPPN
jgi:hypothetical protein